MASSYTRRCFEAYVNGSADIPAGYVASADAARIMGSVADWTAITGIVVSGVVGPATAAGFALWHQARSQDHDREMTDLGELRVLLSEASADLREAEGCVTPLAQLS